MQYIFWIVFAIGLLLLVIATVNIFRKKYSHVILNGILGILCCVVSILGLSALLNYYTYSPIQDNNQIATVTVKKTSINDDSYQVRLSSANSQEQEYFIQGKEWELAARILNWDGLIKKLGIKNSYRLEKLSSHNRGEATSHIQTVYELSTNDGLDFAMLAYKHPHFIPLINRIFGSAVYMPLSNGAQYAIYIGTNGLVAKPLNDEAKKALKH